MREILIFRFIYLLPEIVDIIYLNAVFGSTATLYCISIYIPKFG